MDQFDATGKNGQTDSKDVNQELDDLLANPFSDPFAQPAVIADNTTVANEVINPDRLIDRLPEERQKQALALAGQIDENNMQAIISYGAAAQKQLGEFSHSMLDHVQNQDTGEIGDSLNDLMYRLNEAKPEDLRAEDNNVFRKIFGKVKQSAYEMTAKYQKIGAQIDKIAIKLDKEKNGLLNDNVTLEQLYQKNKDYFEALNIYIAAGEVKMEDLQKNAIPKAIQTAEVSQSQMDVQIVNDLKQFLDRLEKRTHDLRLTRQMTIQQAPQIRLIQNTNQALAEKIQSSIHTAIPLWKNQVAIALTLLRQKDAVTAQRQVSQTTNDLMRKNSEMLKISAIETAKENERGVIDIETLKQTQQDLIETLEETLKIQQEGRIKRREAEKELSLMENDLKVKLLNIHQQEQQIH
ncbi:toxic anion resistance protein [Trichococcus shcherbakoviae]|uniref:Toxic anion resistance n=2 Tax=Trichococcus shcherbakoviae TaxID=2094020 RepID=A0A383TFR7_9LACT|nr:toxic anion resistance protein [Trichococcus shcherbakoviae]OUL09056.1 toxic anion resistance protein [Sedimentibacter sp. SX930]TNV69379.1 toxic anion resistance protein [Trichococcus shcherbakoviae subsp. psychrophilus]SYZ78717.1 toxic anion resistance [Trichococcus shcherbakoviae]